MAMNIVTIGPVHICRMATLGFAFWNANHQDYSLVEGFDFVNFHVIRLRLLLPNPKYSL
jgi:hypothetical protein